MYSLFDPESYPDLVHLITAKGDQPLPDAPHETGLYYFARVPKEFGPSQEEHMVQSIKEAMKRSLSGAGMQCVLSFGNGHVCHVTDAELDILYNRSINSVRRVPGTGIVLWDNQVRLKDGTPTTLVQLLPVVHIKLGINKLMNTRWGRTPSTYRGLVRVLETEGLSDLRVRDTRSNNRMWLPSVFTYMGDMLSDMAARRLVLDFTRDLFQDKAEFKIRLHLAPPSHYLTITFRKEGTPIEWSIADPVEALLPHLYSTDHPIHEVVDIK